jgi:hypothetical protein
MEQRGNLEKVLGVGIDESNHGRPNEIFSAVFSYDLKDFEYNIDKYKKIRDHSIKNFYNRLNERDFSFLVLPKKIIEVTPVKNLIGITVASLLQDLKTDSFDKLKIFLDGEWRFNQKSYLLDYTSEFLEIEKSRINLDCGKHYDESILIVNLADNLSHYLFRESRESRKTNPLLSMHKKRKEIIIKNNINGHESHK